MFEENAKEYAEPYIGATIKSVNNSLDVIVFNTYLAGAFKGYNKANEWHDLRIDSNDLPKECNREYYCYTTDGYKSVGVYKLAGDDEVRWDSMSRVIGWLGAPEFKEAKEC